MALPEWRQPGCRRFRGHEVTLYEKTNKLGGLVPLASMVRELEIQDIMVLPRYLETQITKLGVNIKLGQEFSASVIEKDKPDVVILATGGRHEVAGNTGH